MRIERIAAERLAIIIPASVVIGLAMSIIFTFTR
jgi:hypothetical protein